jgi:hypothetical protein
VLALKIRPTTTPSASTSKSSSLHCPEGRSIAPGDQPLELKTAEYLEFAKRVLLVMRKTRIKSPRQPRGLERTNRKDHKLALASLTLLAVLLIAGLSGWIFKSSSVAGVHPRPEYGATPLRGT